MLHNNKNMESVYSFKTTALVSP